MNIAWNPPGLSSAIDRLMDLWDENVGVPMRRANAMQPSPPEPPVEQPAPAVIEQHGRHDAPEQGRVSALAALAGG